MQKQSYPKIMSFNEAEEQGIVNQRKPYKDEWMIIYNRMVTWLDRGTTNSCTYQLGK